MSITRRGCLTLLGGFAYAADTPLDRQWREIAAQSDGTVGAVALHLPSGRRASLNGGDRFPLASVCKLPIGIHILALVDEGKLKLEEAIEIPRYEVVPGVSVVADRWPRQKRYRLNELLELMIARSDNSAVETLLRIGGGPTGMAARFAQWHIEGMRIDRRERRCALDAAGVKQIPAVTQCTPGMYAGLTRNISAAERLDALRRFIGDIRDTATPDATVELLKRAFAGELLSRAGTARLVQILEATTTGPARIRGLLPAGTVVAHKTGTTGSAGAFNGSTNDAGVIAGKLAIAVYVKGSSRDLASREAIIARLAKAAFDAFLG